MAVKSNTKEKEKRKVRTYKAVDSVYEKAQQKAIRQKTTLAKKIEDMLYDYISR